MKNSDVAVRWAHRDGSGEIGFISSVTSPFCGDCVRARLSADGRFVTCLFASGGHDIRALIHNGAEEEDLQAAIERCFGIDEKIVTVRFALKTQRLYLGLKCLT